MGALPARAHTGKSRNEDTGGFLSGLLWGLGFALAGAVLSLFLGAVIANGAADPDALFLPFGFGALVICALTGGLGIGLKCPNAVLPCALLLGCILLGLGLVAGLFFGADARQALTLGLGLGASLGLRAGFVAMICAAAVLTQQIKDKIASQPRRRR
jgi:hypothetical protein